MYRGFALLIIGICFPAIIYSAIVKGKIVDAKTGDELIGAAVYIKELNLGTISGLDGTYVIKNIPEGNYTVSSTYMGYKSGEIATKIKHDEIRELDFKLWELSTELDQIVVKAVKDKSSDMSARLSEKQADQVLNVVGSKSIELSPDLTVANVLARVSGVTLERNSAGEAEYAILRGMDKRYNITMVNGVKISSPNNKQRFVPLNIFPSELLDRLEVSKTQTSEMEGDATGGAVNMLMKDSPSTFAVKANIASGYNSVFLNREMEVFNRSKVIGIAPYEQHGSSYSATMKDFGNGLNAVTKNQPLPNVVAGLSVGDRILDKKLGYIFAANFQNIYKGTNSTFFEDEMVQTESTLRLTSVKDRTYSESQLQYGIHAKFDYTFSDNHKLELYNFWLSNENYQVRQSTSTNFKLSYEPEKGTVDLSYQTRMRNTEQQILASMLQGEHFLFEKLSLNWTGVYSRATYSRPDQTTINLDNLRQNFIDNINIDGDGSERRWEHNSDQDISAIAHLKYHLPVSFGTLRFQSGGLFRMKDRSNFFVRYVFKPIDTNQSFETTDQIKWYLYTPKGSVNPLTYDASENIGAGYFQARLENKNLEAIVGIRVENTTQGYHMYYPNAGEDPDAKQAYTDILPNVHLKYKPSDSQNWRASYYRSINRPGFFEIVPYQIKYEEYDEYGNKDLKHAVIENLDLRWEYFPKPSEQILIGAFFKDINSPIEYAYFSVNQRQSGYGPQNLGDAQNYGFEVDVIKYFRIFGIKANYTYTNSNITTPKVYYGKDENGNTRTLTKDQTRPLVGQAAHVANISFLLKDVKNAWDGQIAASYTGDKITIASRFLNSDYWQKGSVELDASIEKKFKNGLSVFTKANNLLNTPLIEYIKTYNPYNSKFPDQGNSTSETIIRKDYFGQSFLVGIRYKL